MPLITLRARDICNWNSFHQVFAERFGFPDFYGRNMDAWIDCMTCLDDPVENLSQVCGSKEDIVVLQIDKVDDLPRDIYNAIVECSSLVNWRRIQNGKSPILAISFYKSS